MTLQEWLECATLELRAISPTPRLDAEVLLTHASHRTRAELISRATEALMPHELERLALLLARRVAGEPVAYLTGHREFWSMKLAVSPATLIPRPDTEVLVERALMRIAPNTHCRVVDLGTGSGAIAIAIAKERPQAAVMAIDVSVEALAIAQGNARQLGVANIQFSSGTWCSPLTARVDVIVSNPPYIPIGDPHLTNADVRFEPRLALEAGHDGLSAIREIADQARHHLVPGGWLLLEHGFDQADSVAHLLRRYGYTAVAHHRDYAGHERVTEAQRP